MKAPNLLLLPVARARAPSNRSKAVPKPTTSPAAIQLCVAARYAPTIAMPNPIRVSVLGVSRVQMKTRATGASIRARNEARNAAPRDGVGAALCVAVITKRGRAARAPELGSGSAHRD